MIEETQEEINVRLAIAIQANTSSIINENLRAVLAESKIKMCVTYKGKKATPEDLPASGNTAGDFWYVESNRYGYFWNGTQWESVGEITKGVSASAGVTKTAVDPTGNKTTTITCQTGTETPTTAAINCPDIKIVASSESATEAGTIYFVTGS